MADVMNRLRNGLQKVTHPTTSVKVADVELHLEQLWAQFMTEVSQGQAVMRACMSNLIVYCDTMDEGNAVDSEIAAIVDVHPARVLVLKGDGLAGDYPLEAGVTMYYDTLTDGWQVCAERIDVVSSIPGRTRLPSVVRSMLIGDLPTTLWWTSRKPPLESGGLFFQLSELANQIIYDNVGWTQPAKHVAEMTRWIAGQQDAKVFFNLAWRRIANWRKLISQVLDPMVADDALLTCRLIEIEHGPHALPMTWLLVGWLACQLDWTPTDGKRFSGSELIWRFTKDQREIQVIARRLSEGEPLIYRMQVNWGRPEKPGKVCFQRLDNERVGIISGHEPEASRTLIADTPPRAWLVSAQLAHRSRDKLFENALKVSNRMTAVFQS